MRTTTRSLALHAAALAAVAALTLPVASHAQARAVTQVRTAAMPVAPAIAAPNVYAVAIPEGTTIPVITTERISSKTASEGDHVALKVDEDIVVNGVTVIQRGASVRASVSEAQGAGFMGRGGKLSMRVESVSAVDGQRVNLRASRAKVGDNKTGTTVALTVLFGPIGLLKKGKDAVYPEGTRFSVYTDQAVTIEAPGASR
jgi:hypothetical protein